MRQKIVAGNWKMNKTSSESITFIEELITQLKKNPVKNDGVLIVVAPPYTSLLPVYEYIKHEKSLILSAQNCCSKDKGAFTGEVSAEMLIDVGCQFVIIGHSERRTYYYEQDDLLREKVEVALKNRLKVIFCCGEVLIERQNGCQYEVVLRQLQSALFHLTEENFADVVIAYEPVWAIGTGVTASPDEAQEMHAFIRKLIAEKYGASVAESVSILYGGSCNAKNAAELFDKKDVDGGLIGGASLIAEDFVSIIHSI